MYRIPCRSPLRERAESKKCITACVYDDNIATRAFVTMKGGMLTLPARDSRGGEGREREKEKGEEKEDRERERKREGGRES